jgi:hypothetical protein
MTVNINCFFIVIFQIHRIYAHMNKVWNVTFRSRSDSALVRSCNGSELQVKSFSMTKRSVGFPY